MMPKIVRKGILARPGEYKYGDVTEVKTAEELKAAVERQPSFMITLGHPTDSASAGDYLGRVDQYWNESGHVDGTFSFYEEYFDRIPESLQDKIVNYEPLPISAGFSVEEVVDREQRGILYDHVALLRGDVTPICPLDKCGINLTRRESNELSNKRYEQKTEITENTTNTTTVPVAELVPEESSEPDSIASLKAEIVELRGEIKTLTEQITTEPVREPEEVVEQQTAEPELPEPEPELIIPSGATNTSGMTLTDEGTLVVSGLPANTTTKEE